jgi:hypothetical protein
MGIMNPCIAAFGCGKGTTVAALEVVCISEQSAIGSANWVVLPVRVDE